MRTEEDAQENVCKHVYYLCSEPIVTFVVSKETLKDCVSASVLNCDDYFMFRFEHWNFSSSSFRNRHI